MSRYAAWVVCVMATFSFMLPSQAHTAGADSIPANDEERLVFSFFDIPGLTTESQEEKATSARPGWELVGLPLDPPAIYWEADAVKISSTALGQSRLFRFYVPSSGMYLFEMTGRLHPWGANIALRVDGEEVGRYMGYAPQSVIDHTQRIGYMRLDAGWHTLKVEAAELSPGAERGRMWVKELILIKQDGDPPLNALDVHIDAEDLVEGMRAQLTVTGSALSAAGEEVPVSLAGAAVQYGSSDPQVARVDRETGSVSAVGAGEATLIATVDWNGEAKTAHLQVRVGPLETAKTQSTIYTPAKVENARRNARKYGWALDRMVNAVTLAERYLQLGWDFLWHAVPPQTLPRSIFVNDRLGSPTSGRAIYQHGNYPWIVDPVNMPWKVKDPVTGEIFPTNDFGAYYESGLNEHGIFDPELANRSLLVNELYPEKGPTWGVDDGFGWTDEQGNRYTFIAYYTHFALWNGGIVQSALNAFRDAFIFTGNRKYAQAGIVLLDRIADIYPSLDTSQHGRDFRNNDPGTGQGKAIGSIWDTGLVKDFLYAYDAFFPAMDDHEVIAFLSQKAEQYGLDNAKTSAAAIRKNIERGIVEQVYPTVQKAQIYGNNGMHQSALALAAVVYDHMPETGEWLDFIFRTGTLLTNPYRVTGGNVGATLVNDVDRDGFGSESSPLYNSAWLDAYMEMAEILDGYELYPQADLYAHPKFEKMLSAFIGLIMSNRFTPSIGDAGGTGSPGIFGVSVDKMVKAFQHYGDPLFAQAAYLLNNNSTSGIHDSIFAENPDDVARAIREVIDEYGPLQLKSSNLTGYGFAALRDGSSLDGAMRDVWMYYGTTDTYHAHYDALNIGLHAYGLDLAPDLGYPETNSPTDAHHFHWVENTVSHNTVVVDNARQKPHTVGEPRHFDHSPWVQLMDVEAPNVYPQTDRYRRTTAMVRVDEQHSYVVDFFRVKGGTDHHFVFHGAEGPVSVEGLQLVKQETGTYAGPDVPYGVPEGENKDYRTYQGSGFHFLANVSRDDSPEDIFSVDWDIVDSWGVLTGPLDVHLRLTMLGEMDDVAMADGIPPQMRERNPDSLRYLIAHRNGTNLDSLFLSVIEPYAGERFVKNIAPVKVKAGGRSVDGTLVKAVKVELENGRTDYIVSSLDPEIEYTVDDRFRFKGAFGLYTERNGRQVFGYVNDGTLIGKGDQPIVRSSEGRIEGKVEDFTRELSSENEITVDMELGDTDPSELVGRYIYIQNDGEQNGVYRIRGVTHQGGSRYTLDVGNVTLIRRYVDSNDFDNGFIYNIAAGDPFTIPLSYSTRRD